MRHFYFSSDEWWVWFWFFLASWTRGLLYVQSPGHGFGYGFIVRYVPTHSLKILRG